tara:strand:- start:2729 stop:4165 length:1437 start_codon:yes stop_codon:yes gene_type:complete
MKINNILKYFIRLMFLQSLITFVTIWYFDNFVFLNQEHKYNIYLKLVEDRERFYNIIPLSWITIDGLIFALVALFLILLYSTKFYTYVNELDFSYDNSYLDDFFMLYLMWNSYLFSALYLFRISGLSRGYLMLFTIIIPTILLIFRNSEVLSILLGRSVINENFISFNLDEFTNFRNLRIIAFRKNIQSIQCSENDLLKVIPDEVSRTNKIKNINLVIIKLNSKNNLGKELEEYLINLNKKVLIISNNELSFQSNFIYRLSKVERNYLYYFNNDIQYGAKYIIKRLFDISLSFLLIIALLPILIMVYVYIWKLDSTPVFIKQNRVGLHGKSFNMLKFRTMYQNSHEKRDELKDLNPKKGPLFKIENDPRLIKGAEVLRRFSIDELPQLINVIKGDMSLVGPRPLFVDDTEYFDKNYMRRLNVLPGMTGLLQINDRNTDDFEVWYKYDIEYIENWSLYLDLKIILKTFSIIFKTKNTGV